MRYFDPQNGHQLIDANSFRVREGAATVIDHSHQIIDEHMEALNKYLEAKGANVHVDGSYIMNGMRDPQPISTSEMTYIKNSVKDALKSGDGVSISIFPLNSYNPKYFIDLNSHKPLDFSGGHIVTITGVLDDGFIVDTWGRKALLPYNQLTDDGLFGIKRYTFIR